MPGVEGELDSVLALYRSVVLDHYRKPRNRGPLERPDASATVYNPVCGDQVLVEVALEQGRVAAISARARGCSIAVAAASVMTELVRDGDRERVAALRAVLDGIVAGEPPAPDLDERLRAFAGVAPHRARHRCATLAWEALEEALRSAGA